MFGELSRESVGYAPSSFEGVQLEASFLSLRKACCPALAPGVTVGQGRHETWLPLLTSLLLNSQYGND